MDPVEPRQQLDDLGARQHHRQLPRLFRPYDRSEVPEFAVQHPPVEERDRVQGLILGRRGHIAVDRQMAQERHDLPLPHLPRMSSARKPNEAANPLDVRLLGPNAVVAKPHHPPGLVDETPRPHTILSHGDTPQPHPQETQASTRGSTGRWGDLQGSRDRGTDRCRHHSTSARDPSQSKRAKPHESHSPAQAARLNSYGPRCTIQFVRPRLERLKERN